MREHLEICARIEETVGDVYRLMAESKRLSASVRMAMRQLAFEEDEHASQFRFAMRLPEGDLGGGYPEGKAAARACLDVVLKMLDDVGRLELDDRRAVEIGLELEEMFLPVHIAHAFEFKERTMKEMFTTMVANDEEHCKQLMQLKRRLDKA